ncbi:MULTISPECIES: phosphoglucosamine mutase [Calothrix]|uniref:Phosphoglucosamine mutase n=2 Tax=Calothrix TaxID=1186 RepID=A0ABR8A4W7_9CYAN|nr:MULTISPECIES: phosphoglucosamine mutase [Calothrix]MBD2194629.1 phosphoglucosamine mutase [Calothrix parietina FACHB-288]MBD2223265.1 phosphoglucosamine mutase [Calothrix anomala FACHB-343]
MVSSITRTQSGLNEVSAIADNIIANNFAPNLISLPKNPLFGTDGIRGRVGDLLNAPLALQIGYWAGIVLQTHAKRLGPVILGQDSRNSSDMLAMALSAGLTAAGIEVWYLGLCPTPCVAYLTSITDAIGGVMISASHNPPEDNGIKIFGADGGKLPLALQAEIEAGLRGNKAVIGVNNCGRHYSRQELVTNYGDALKQPLQGAVNLQGMKIVLDLAWGAAVGLAPKVFREMGAEVICLHNEADGDRINVDCGSTHLEMLQATVQEHNANVGFAFDGDADRVLAVDSTGRQVNGDYILYLWGRHLKQQQQLPDNLIVSTVMANLGFERAWEQLGGKLIRTAVGDQYVQAEMLRTGGMLGGEQSGHILCLHYGMTGDGLLTALHIAALIKEAGVELHEMVDQSFQTYPQLLKNVRVLDRDRRMAWKDCEPLQKAIAQAETAMGDAGRILVRVSGTEPVIRVMVEAANAELAHHWTNELVSQVQQHLG